jgi:hypothetical protein
MARNSQGYNLFEKSGGRFASLLPSGSPQNAGSAKLYGQSYNSKKGCALDCIFDEANMTFHVLDIISWEGVRYEDFPLCSRILFMLEKF